MRNKKITISISIVLFTIIFITILTLLKPINNTLTLSNNYSTSIVAPGYSVSLLNTEENYSYGIKDEIYHINISSKWKQVGTATITLRIVPNGDVFHFIHLVSSGRNEIALHVKQPFEANRYTFYDFGEHFEENDIHDPKVGTDPATNSIGYLEFQENDYVSGSVFLGREYEFRSLTHTYEEKNLTSYIKEFIAEKKQFEMSVNEKEHYLNVITSAKDSESEMWYVVSGEALFSTQEDLARAEEIGKDEFKWLTPSAVYNKGPWSIRPETKMGFLRSLVRTSSRQSLLALEETDSRFFESINWNAFLMLNEIRNPDGLWYTNYTSTWLERNYGIPTNYVDSRHNDNIFRAQERRALLLGITGFEDDYKIYADFLVKQFNDNKIMKTSDGAFIVDYFSEYSDDLPHVSLNHALSIMNYLYFSYKKSRNEQYLNVADEILQAIIDTNVEWITEDGDLYYQRNHDGTYEGGDYPRVTYYDLLYTRTLLKEIKDVSVIEIDNLIKTKEAFLRDNGIPFEIDITLIEKLIGIIE
ncbi:hypothetical protein [Bacillus alkalisoli]|uniref:hypothetical protein n=1 Tax=Bacillus alkalisoli TaxID=2011008 RepID=UPI000C24A1C5|nr:hypothetical protein [Bacillus alkalisoli]